MRDMITKPTMTASEMGKKGGSVKSERKAAASRANGARPKKKKEKVDKPSA